MLIIDGHNLIGRARGLSLEEEERGREEVLRRVGAAKGSGGEQVLVVFDGNRPDRRVASRFGGIRVAYSAGGRTADDEIVSRLESGATKGITVVTSDRNLADRCRARGAKVQSCEAFLARLDPDRNSEQESPKKPQSSPAEVEHWLSIFEKK